MTTTSMFVRRHRLDKGLGALSAGLGSGTTREPRADELTWTLEEAAQHFREVTMPNAYQDMAGRIDGAS